MSRAPRCYACGSADVVGHTDTFKGREAACARHAMFRTHPAPSRETGRPVCPAAVHAALRADRARLEAETVHVGFMRDGYGGRLELRNCPCGSTLAVVVEPAAESSPVDRRMP